MATDTQAASRHTTGAQPSQLRRERRISTPRAVLAVAVLGTFMAFVDATIVNIAVPNIAHDFDRPLASVSWVLNAYNIVFAAFLVGGGQLADLLGRRRVFTIAIALFTTASALCAVAPTLGLLIAARALQAAGAAALVPSSLAIVLEAHDQERRTHAVALWSAVAALAAGIGPPLGGLLITASSWRLVFLVNIPVGIPALLLTRRVIVESRAPGRRRVPDLLGALVLSAAIALLVLAIVKGQEWGWGDVRTIVVFALALLLGVYFVLRSGRRRVPVVDLGLLRIPAFGLSNGVTVVMASGFYAYTLCNVLFLTTVWRYSILTAGLALTPGPFTAMAVAGPASRLVERYGHRPVLVPGALIWAGGMAYFATQLGVQPDFLGKWLPGMLILGVGAGMAFPTLSGAAVGSVPGPRFAIATSLNSVARQLGAALGVAVLVAILGTPSPLQALHAFERGWWFAGACFFTGALACLALRVTHSREAAEAQMSPVHSVASEPTDRQAALAKLPSLADSGDDPTAVASQTPAEFLRGVPLFAELEPELLDRVAALAEQVGLARGEWLFRADEEPDAVYALRLGQLQVVGEHGGVDGEALTLNTLTRGAVLGELALLNGSRRSASVRALRDSELLRIARPAFEQLLRSEPELALGLTRALSTQLQASRAIVPEHQETLPVTIALYPLDGSSSLLDLADRLSRELCAYGSVAVLYRADATPTNENDASAGASASERFAPLIERCEREHERVLMVCDAAAADSEWSRFCLSRADRVVAIATCDPNGGALPTRTEQDKALEPLHGSDLLLYGTEPGRAGESGCGGSGWIAAIVPRSIYAVASGASECDDLARVARRLAGRAVGVVLSGGGARAFAHLGALDVLLDAGLCVDRVAGVSMGAFVGGLLACGRDAAEIDACCYEEWVRRNPINDYTLPRSSLIKGQKAEAMLERTFGETRIEQLSRSFYCASVDLRASHLMIDRDGPLADAIASSMALPLIGPPHRRDGSLRVDGSLLDNLPIEPMAQAGEGPILAIDVKGGEERRPAPAAPAAGAASDGGTRSAMASARTPRRLPSLPETMARIALLSSASTGESARRYADLTISARVSGVGLLEFHQIDQAREVGRRAALAALEDAPKWLTGDGSAATGEPRRTVVRV